jgi:flagellar FliL protein
MADKAPAKDKKDDKAQPAAAVAAATTPEATDAEQPKRPSGLFAILKAFAFVSVVVVVEVVAASMFIPSAQETEKLARQYVAATEGEEASAGSAEGEAHGEEGHEEETVEVELGTFNITHYNPASNATLSIDFELFGAVMSADEAEFQHLFEKSNARVREQVILTLHAAEAKDLSDAGLGLIKRQLLEKTNRALGQPILHEVLFSKFNFVER